MSWSEKTHNTVAICVAVCMIFILAAITLWVHLVTDANVEQTKARAHVCQSAPAPQIATCLKLNK